MKNIIFFFIFVDSNHKPPVEEVFLQNENKSSFKKDENKIIKQTLKLKKIKFFSFPPKEFFFFKFYKNILFFSIFLLIFNCLFFFLFFFFRKKKS